MTTVRRVSVGSAFKIGVIFNAILSIFVAVLTFILPSILFAGLGASYSNDPQMREMMSFTASASLVTMCIMSVAVMFMGAIFGGIYFAVIAFLYNLTAGWVGGLEVELQQTPSGFVDQIEYDAYNKRKNF